MKAAVGPSEFEIYCLRSCNGTGVLLSWLAVQKAEPAACSVCDKTMKKQWEKESGLGFFRQDGRQFFELNCCVSFLYQEAFLLGCDKVGKQRHRIQVCRRAELLQTKGCSCS